MKTKKANEKESSKKYLRIVSYVLFFYFGMRLIVLPIIFIARPEEVLGGIATFIVNIILILFGLFAAYNLMRTKRWGLIAVIALFVVQIISIFAFSASFGMPKVPFVQIAILLLLIGGFKHLKNVEQ